MSEAKHVVTGEVAFSNLLERDVYKGKPTKFSLTLTFDNAEAAKLEALGVKLKQYQPKDEDGNPKGEAISQRKFATDYPPVPVDAEGQPLWVKGVDEPSELPRGSQVRIWFKGVHNEEHGLIPYLGGVRVLELAEADAPEEF
jgi:hypothetical protein